MSRLALALMLSLALSAPALARPQARCEAVQLGRRTLVRVELHRLFDRALLRLVRLGLEGRIEVELTLVRRRRAWFDDTVLRVARKATLAWDPEARRYLVNGAAIAAAELDPLRLGRVSLGRRQRPTAGNHYVEVAVELEVVTASSLLTAAGWLTGDRRARADGVSLSVARAVANDLVRTATGRCPVVRARS